MLICPQCQSENANTNKFCQGCGTPLTFKFCHECGTQVALNAELCHNCGAQTGMVWWAIVMGVVETPEGLPVSDSGAVVLDAAGESKTVEPLLSSMSQQEAEGTAPPAPLALSLTTHRSPLTTSALPVGAYLDLQQRYQLLDPLEMTLNPSDRAEAQVRVLDCQPFQLSPLEAGANLMVAQSIPAIAKTYIALNAKFGQNSSHKLPKIHDAWQQGNQQVILIADRSEWQELMQMWHERSTTPMQIMQWFDDMVRLWLELEPWHCRQSLLELSNLRVDATGNFGLQRLYPDPAQGDLTLQDLGQIWQQLFQESQRTKFGSLVELLLDLTAGDIQTTDELQSRLQATTSELQLDEIDTPYSPSVLNTEQEAAADRGKVGVTLNNSAAPTVIQMNESQENCMKSEELPTLMLPMYLVSIEDAGNTDVGRQRHHNEDCFGIITKVDKYVFPNDRTIEAQGIYILCDGMGGHAGGEVASALAVKKLQEYFHAHWQPYQALPNEASIREAIRIANQGIFDLNQQDARSGVGRMGTTLVLVLVHNNQISVAHVGDSRLYSFSRKRGLEQVTLDHEVGQREILRGVEPAIAYARPDAYQLTQALGPRDENYVNPDVSFVELNEDTLLILVSDGVSDNGLLEQHWETHIEPLLNSGASLERGVSELIELANQYNGHDNITVVLVRLKVRPKLEH